MAQNTNASRILLVDDDPGTLSTYAAILRLAGFEASTVESGADGLSVLERQHIDLVLCDLCLPDMSGLDFVRKLGVRPSSPPVIVVTGFGSVASAVEALRLGVRDYVEKPLFEPDLLSVVRRSLNGTHLTRESITEPPVVGPAARRWAQAVATAVAVDSDTKTIEQWAKVVGLSRSVLRISCTVAGIKPKTALDFVRLLRCAVKYGGRGLKFCDVLDVIDPRTLSHILDRAGLAAYEGRVPSLQQFMEMQRLVLSPSLLVAIHDAIQKTH
jgi:DNA-binding response OmpR family regulator